MKTRFNKPHMGNSSRLKNNLGVSVKYLKREKPNNKIKKKGEK